jgi:hypothetical protein
MVNPPHAVPRLSGRVYWTVREEALERRLSEGLDIVEAVAKEAGIPQDPCFALALLNEDEQRRLYALLKGGAER